MNILDRTILFINPKLGYQRMAWRQAAERSYDAGDNSRRNSGWKVVNGTAEQTDSIARDTIRARARDLERNSDIAESIINAYVRNVIGRGFRLQSKIVNNNGKENDNLNKEIEELFKEWCKPKNCDISGQQSFKELCAMAVRRLKVDGGILFIKTYTKDKQFPFKLQAREVDELDTNLNWRNETNNNRIIGGIEIDEYNKPIAYHFKEYTPDGYYTGKTVRINAEKVIYIYQKNRPTQVREMSLLARTIGRVRDVNEFVEAVSVKARVEACLGAFITKMDPGGSGLGRGGRSNKDTKSGYEQQTLTPGMIMELQPGEDVKAVNPSSSGSSAKDFIMTQQRLIGSGQGLSYETISRDMSQVNYSSARQGLLEDQKTYKDIQDFLIDHFLDDVYEDFLNSMILIGKLNIKDFNQNKSKYMKHIWIAPGWGWIDPLKEVKANQTAIESNIDTLARICAERGEDWRDVLEQRAREKEYELELGGGEPQGGEQNTKKTIKK
ncbi:MAG: phage portal protein [Peptostreptococcaceae bacterium]